MMATRTTTTRTTSFVRGPSADSSAEHAGFSFRDLVEAYFDCRHTKRNSASALAFEADLERNLVTLFDELHAGTYQTGRSICFVVTRPKPREVWAAAFRDRIVHHLLYNHISPRFHASFIADSCACIPGRGTLYAAERLEAKIRSVTQNWARPAYYLKLDLANPKNAAPAICRGIHSAEVSCMTTRPARHRACLKTHLDIFCVKTACPLAGPCRWSPASRKAVRDGANRNMGCCHRTRLERSAGCSPDGDLCRKRGVVMAGHCEHCHDGYGGTVYPYYGVGPHVCGWRLGKPVVGHSEGVPKQDWPENFTPDPEHGDQDDGRPPLGTWTHCLHCGAGKEPTPQGQPSAGLSHGADHG